MVKLVSTEKDLNDFWQGVGSSRGGSRRISLPFSLPRWLDLRFPGPLEQSFARYHRTQAIIGGRVAIAFVGIVLLLGAVLDAVLMGGTAQKIWAMRLPCLTVLVGLFLLSYSAPFKHLVTIALWIMSACITATFLSYSDVRPVELRLFYGLGLAPMILMAAALFQATLAATALLLVSVFVGANLYWMIYFSQNDAGQWLVCASMFLMVSVAGYLCLYPWEQWRRKQFLVHQKNELAKFSSDELENESEKLRFLVALDAELGIANRRSFDRALRQEWRRASRTQYPVAVVLMSVKSEGSSQSHESRLGQTGDDDQRREAQAGPSLGELSEVAQLASTFARRPGDLVARYGDKTVAVLLVDTDRQNALVVGRRLQEQITHRWHKQKRKGVHSLCVGISSMLPSPAVFPQDLTSNADTALARSISSGTGAIVDL